MGIFDTIRDTAEDVQEEAEEAVDEAVDQAQDAARNVGEAVEDVQEGAEETAEEVSEGIQEAAGEVSEGAQDVASEVSQGDLGGAVDEASDTVREVSDTASETVSNVASGSADVGSSGGGSSGGGGSSPSSSGGGGSPGSSTSGSRGSGGSGASPEQLRNTLTGNFPEGERPEVNQTEARDANIINEDFAKTGGRLFENPAETELSSALNPGQADTINEQFNQAQRRRNAETFLQSRETIDKAEERREDLETQIQKIQSGPSRQERLQDLKERKQDILEDSERTGAVYDISGLNQAIQNLENSEGLYTLQTGSGETETVSKSEALSELRTARENLGNDINRLRDTRKQSLDNLFSLPEGNQGPSYGKQSFAELAGSQDQGSQRGGSTVQYRRNPQAIQEINRLQDQLTNSVMPQSQREDIKNRIDQLQIEARKPAETIGGTDIPGQSYRDRLPLPESAQDMEVTRYDPVSKAVRGVENRVDNFLSRPESRNVEDVELSNDLLTQVGAGVDTLTSKEGYTYVASLVPGGTSPEDVAERSIERRLENPQTGPERVGELALQSPGGLVATFGAGAAVGAGSKAASVLGSSPRVAQAVRAAGAGAAGLYAGSQGAKVQRLASQGETTRAGGEALRTVGELGGFGKGFKAFRRFDSPTITRTSVSQAENTLRQVDDSVYRGAGRLEATTNFQRGPFSTRVLGLDETGQVSTNVNYATIVDDTSAEARGVLSQEIPDSDDTVERTLEAQSRVLRSSDDGSQSVTRDLVRTEEEGTLFRRFRDFEDTSINRRINRENVDQITLRGENIRAQGVEGTFPNTFRTPEDTVVQRNVDARASQFESTSLSRTEDQLRENFGESRNLVMLDEGAGGGSGMARGTSGGGGQRSLTVQELGGYPGGSPVNQRGLFSQARSAARDAVSPNLGGRQYLSGGAGFGVVNQAEAALGDGQRAVNQFGGQDVQNFQAEGDVSLQRDQVQSQRFSDEGGQMVSGGQVQVQRMGDGLNDQFQGSITGQLGETRTSYEGENVGRIRRTPAGRLERDTDRVGERPVSFTDRMSRLRESGRSRVGMDLDLGVGQRGRQDLGQRGVNIPGVTQVPGLGLTQAQTPSLGIQLRSFQRTQPQLQRFQVGRPGFTQRGRPGLPGFDFGADFQGQAVSGETRSMIGRGEVDPTYDIISAGAVEASTGEQARFDVNDTESLVRKQEELGAFVRNKPVQAQNLEYGKSETGRREFF